MWLHFLQKYVFIHMDATPWNSFRTATFTVEGPCVDGKPQKEAYLDKAILHG